ncbi:MAG: PP2C family protein-serine/threonine phosphatase [Bdellovibrionota bacterium]
MKTQQSNIVRAYGAVSDPGPNRELNEDAYLAAPDLSLFGVADGFGGNGAGDVTAKKSLEHVRHFVQHGLGDREVTLPFVYRSYYTASENLIFNAFLYANQQICAQNKEVHVNARGGASVLFVFFHGRLMTLANVGSCAAFLVRRGRTQVLSKPRSYNTLKGVFQGSWNSKWAFPLTAMGLAPDLEPEITQLSVEKGDLIYLVTDGVYPRLGEEDFSQSYSVLSHRDAMDVAIKEKNQELITLAQHKGNTDNQALVSVVCA